MHHPGFPIVARTVADPSSLSLAKVMLPRTSQLSRSRLPSCCSRDLEISSRSHTPRLSSRAHTRVRSPYLSSPYLSSLRTPYLSSVAPHTLPLTSESASAPGDATPSREMQRRAGRRNAVPRVAMPSQETQRRAASRNAAPGDATPRRESPHRESRLAGLRVGETRSHFPAAF
jgi:hypothetical protein